MLWKRAKGFFSVKTLHCDPGLCIGTPLGRSKCKQYCMFCEVHRVHRLAALLSRVLCRRSLCSSGNTGGTFNVIYSISPVQAPSQVLPHTTLSSWWVAVPWFPGIQKITQNIAFLLPQPPLCRCQSHIHIVHFASSQHLQLTMPLFTLTTELSF